MGAPGISQCAPQLFRGLENQNCKSVASQGQLTSLPPHQLSASRWMRRAPPRECVLARPHRATSPTLLSIRYSFTIITGHVRCPHIGRTLCHVALNSMTSAGDAKTNRPRTQDTGSPWNCRWYSRSRHLLTKNLRVCVLPGRIKAEVSVEACRIYFGKECCSTRDWRQHMIDLSDGVCLLTYPPRHGGNGWKLLLSCLTAQA